MFDLKTSKIELERILADYHKYPGQVRGRFYKACSDSLQAIEMKAIFEEIEAALAERLLRLPPTSRGKYCAVDIVRDTNTIAVTESIVSEIRDIIERKNHE